MFEKEIKKRPMAFYSEKLSGTHTCSSIYDVELAIVEALWHWRHYLVQQELYFELDHKALKLSNGKPKLNC